MPMTQVKAAEAISKAEFHSRLKSWLHDTQDAMVGSEQVLGLTPWIYVRDLDRLFKLHADTKRDAVEDYLAVVDQFGDDLQWTIVPNQRGHENAVAYGPARSRITPFYFYLAEATPVTLAERRYWLTTQWPPEIGNRDPQHRNVYLQEGHAPVAAKMQPGDMLFIYEAATGPTEIEQLADGTQQRLVKRRGKMGIVTVAEIQSPLTRRPPADSITTYADGSVKNWAWMATTVNHCSNGFVQLSNVLRILEFKSNYTMRGFGEKQSGLKEITQVQFEQLLALFRAAPRNNREISQGEAPPPGHWTEGGGEGPVHLALKQYVAANPSLALGEQGVTTIRMEFPFGTGDRADIALQDQIGRFIGLEIEVEQDEGQLEGLLQAIKYRYMLAVMQRVPFEESRSVLLAYRIAPGIKKLCDEYEVQAIELERTTVEAWHAANPQ